MAVKRLAAVTPAKEPALWEQCESYIRAELTDKELEIIPYYEETLLDEIMEHGSMTAEFCERMFAVYEQARKDKVDALLIECSTVGEVSRKAKALYRLFDLPLIPLDEPAAVKAVSLGHKIGMVVNLHTTIEPSKCLLEECAREQGKEIEVLVGYKKAFGMGEEAIRQNIIDTTIELAKEADVIFLAQPSMTKWCDMLQELVDVPVVPVLTHAAKEVKRVLFEAE